MSKYNPLRIIPSLKLKKLEVYNIVDFHTSETITYIIIIDRCRPNKLSDYPEIIGIESEESFEEDFSRTNLIDIFFIYREPIQKEMTEAIESIAIDLTEQRDDTGIRLFPYTEKDYDISDYVGDKGIISFVNNYLSKWNDPYPLIKNIPAAKFNYLSQE